MRVGKIRWYFPRLSLRTPSLSLDSIHTEIGIFQQAYPLLARPFKIAQVRSINYSDLT